MKAGRFIHPIIVTSSLAITNSYAAANRIEIPLGFWPDNSPFYGRLQSMIVQISAISGCASLDFKIASDTAGDYILVPATNATIDTGITTAALGAIAVKVDIDAALSTGDTIYAFFKTNAGTATVTKTIFCWEE